MRKNASEETVYHKWLDLVSTQDQPKANIQKWRTKYWSRNRVELSSKNETMQQVIERLQSKEDTTDPEICDYDLHESIRFYLLVDLSPITVQEKQITKVIKIKCQSKDTRTNMHLLLEMLSKPSMPQPFGLDQKEVNHNASSQWIDKMQHLHNQILEQPLNLKLQSYNYD